MTKEEKELVKAIKGIVAKYGPEIILEIIKDMNYKRCAMCKRVFKTSEFKKKKTGTFYSYCTECTSEYQKKYWKKYRR